VFLPQLAQVLTVRGRHDMHNCGESAVARTLMGRICPQPPQSRAFALS
jgi:hypothetical protein